MLINKLDRFTRSVKQDREGIKPANIAAQLNAANEIYHDADIFFADLIQKCILKVDLGLIQCGVPSLRSKKIVWSK